MAFESIIPQSELEKRRMSIKSELQKNMIDACIIPLGINFYYLFGKEGNPTERIIAGIIPKDGDPFIITPAFEKSNLQRSTGIDDIVIWEETQSPYEILAKEFSNRGINNKIGVDPKLWIVEAERIKKASKLDLISIGDLFTKQRSIKSEWEIQQLKLATEYSAEGILSAIPQLKEGMTEADFRKIIQKELSEKSGYPTMFGLVQFGENSALPHGSPTPRKLKNDEVVLLDCGTSYKGYQGDITITVPFGKPKDFKEIYEIVYIANRKAFDADKEGAIPSELDKIARDYITQKGYGEYFTHRLGHGIGLEVHEDPYIFGNNNTPLLSRNCHSIEPGIYIPGKFGVRIEDDVYVDNNKAKFLYETPRHNFDF